MKLHPITRNNCMVLGHDPRRPAWDRWWREALWDQALPCKPEPTYVLNVPCGGADADGAWYRVRPLPKYQGRARVVRREDGVWCWSYAQPPARHRGRAGCGRAGVAGG
ncbi:MAG TPA: hypothetical protein VK509_23960 [Polyangiales bacterium]|nr:hypothetical protein [Polyangiales bacterium]